MGFFNEILWLLGARSVVKSAEEEALRQQQAQQLELESINQDLDNIEEEIRQIRELVKQREKNQEEAEAQLKQIKKELGEIQGLIDGE